MCGAPGFLFVVLVFFTCGTHGKIVVIPSASVVSLYDLLELKIDGVPPVQNPYDPKQISVEATFTNEKSGNTTVYGFWYQNYTITYVRGEEKLLPNGKPDFRARFAPTATGTYSYSVRILIHNKPPMVTPLQHFTAIAASPASSGGCVRVSRSNSRLFAFEAGEKDNFFPVGQNLCGYETRYNITVFMGKWMTRLAENGATYIRVWTMDNVNDTTRYELAIEKEHLGSYNLTNAWFLDWVLIFAREKDIRVMLTLIDQHSFRQSRRWPKSLYNKANGGFLSKPGEFLTNQRAKDLFKQRARYIISRYGWSCHILSYELWNEIDLMDDYNSDNARDWTKEMATYIKGIDQHHHMITQSMSRPQGDPNVESLPEIDYVQTHHYDNITYGGDIAAFLIGLSEYKRELYPDKPHYFGEFGLAPAMQALPPNNNNLTVLHNGLWSSIVSTNAGTAMSWFWKFIDEGNFYGEYKAVQKVLKGLQFDRYNWFTFPVTVANCTNANKKIQSTRPTEVRGLGMHGVPHDTQMHQPKALIWIQNLQYTWRELQHFTTTDTMQNCTVTLSGTNGYSEEVNEVVELDWFDPHDGGKWLDKQDITTCDLGWCFLGKVPPFDKDIVGKLDWAKVKDAQHHMH
eukprot:TRINITY_DN96232_c0_g1_i1.p1 TRINITY_DN96232_c0_g1~~TRINITY_DN96232_c0_g1_i1.p1  ORF type:complete len:628 (+),score=63.39 TRINITY_DN96232_c0_g1_i1:28-1911(+)